MDKRVKWDPDYSFAMLDMMQLFTDEELKNLGMTPDDIVRFREYQKLHPSSMVTEKQNDQDVELFERNDNTVKFVEITKRREKKDGLPNNNWSKGIVDREQEHLKLFFKEQENPIAIVYRSKEKGLVVQFLTTKQEDQAAVEEVTKELNFYFNELDREYPWEYAIYHVDTASNSYSDVHWAYFPVGWQPR